MKKGVLKKLILIAAVMCLLFTAAGCSEPVTMTIGETTVVEDYVEFTPENVLVSSQVFPPICNNGPLGWSLDNGSKTYVTIVAKVKNLTDEAINTNDLCTFRLSKGEDTFDGSIVARVTNNGTKLTDDTLIKAGKTGTIYFITEMKKADLSAETQAEFAFEDDYDHNITIDTTKAVAVFNKLELGKKIKVKGLCQIEPEKVKFTKQIEPSNPGYTYDYYKAQDEDDKLLVLTAEVKNLSKKKKAAYRFYGITAITEDASYVGGVVADDEYSANITGSEKIGSKESRQTYGVVNLPKAVEKSGCEVYVYVDGTYYQYVVEK